LGLLNHFRKRAKEAWGPGSFYANARPTLDWLAQQGLGADRSAMLQTVAGLVATGAAASDDAAYEYRQTPDGVADELFWRTRQTHPEATLAEIRALVNDANALEVFLAAQDAIAPKKATTPSGSPSGS
jgi:hypothetical protein